MKERVLIELRDSLETARIYAGAKMEELCNENKYTQAYVFQAIRDSLAQNIDLLQSYNTLYGNLDQEPQTGQWKRISIDKYYEHSKYWYRCDRCGKDNLGNTDWCPNCGCRMIEPQESEVKECR